uniref:Uncharacterized protein n=1 Tax=Meloidogyne enterolobii TaxID=390850 RepID=A0A6V7X8E8_MELEN|nr:unnamed protein product [Meloidogyne enterolobii]
MWRFAVLYSLAKSIGRFPGISYTNTWTCEKLNSPREIENTFPVFHAVRYFFDVEGIDNSFYDRTFEDDCCKYYNPKILNKYKSKYLIIAPRLNHQNILIKLRMKLKNYLHFQKVFKEGLTNELKIYLNDNSHKFCVFTRRGDFTKPEWKKWHKATDKEFTEKAIEFIIENELQSENTNAISIVLLGEDKVFLSQLTITNKSKNVYIPESMKRGEDMCFAITICNTLLITASSSTFGWWIGYLLKQRNAKVYFDADFSNSIYKRDNYPSSWIPLIYNNKLKKKGK